MYFQKIICCCCCLRFKYKDDYPVNPKGKGECTQSDFAKTRTGLCKADVRPVRGGGEVTTRSRFRADKILVGEEAKENGQLRRVADSHLRKDC